jgi:hypothetical protein
MTDREKVIKGLERCKLYNKVNCDKCPYDYNGRGDGKSECTAELASDVLALLKEQEHSETFIVIDNKTGKEADTYNIALHEDWAKNLCYCDMEGWAIEEDGTLLLVDECGRFAYADRERFKVKWE